MPADLNPAPGPATAAPPTLPWYLPVADEVALFEAAYDAQLPVLLKGPTGCGKTRFVEHMAARLAARAADGSGRPRPDPTQPLLTIACHEDLTANDLVGRHLLAHDRTVWADGPLTRAVRRGAICYLDEVVEARKDTTVVIHSLADHRRELPIEKTGELLQAAPGFALVMSYNPGYQSLLKDLKPSTRQRFVSLQFNYPTVALEASIIAHEGGVEDVLAERLALLAQRVRALQAQGQVDGVGTRPLVYAAQLVGRGIAPRRAAEVAIAQGLGDDEDVAQAVRELIALLLP